MYSRWIPLRPVTVTKTALEITRTRILTVTVLKMKTTLSYDPFESQDFDRDGIGDNSDEDIDGDGLSNLREFALGTDPYDIDTDGDGALDNKDLFPLTLMSVSTWTMMGLVIRAIIVRS